MHKYAILLAATLPFGCGPKTPSANAGPDAEPAAEPLEVTGTAAAMPEVAIPYEQITLDNGLRLLVHTDRKAPVVAVSVWYHVGSKNEVRGKTGFAHLFEHLMYNGSENFDGEFFEPLQDVGATQVNGTTWFDRTNYFETVPRPALELALWLESDRMGHLLGAVTQKKLDNQRGVVQNEKRQGDNQPYGMVEYRQLEGLFPEGHPYRWSTIGSMADLDAASVDDVKAWFKEYYGPNNAVLVLAGDIDAATAKPLVEKYFGDIPPGPPLHALQSWVPTREGSVRETMTDRVANARIYRSWVVPSRTERDTHLLRVAARILGGGKTSRLYERLVYELQVASSVSAEVEQHELTSLFHVEVDVKQGVESAHVEKLLDAEIARFLAGGPSADEVIGARASLNSSLVKGLESVGGFGGKAPVLAKGLLYAGDPAFWKTALGWVNEAAPRNLRDVSRAWLGRGFYQLTVHPYGEPKPGAVADASIRKTMPKVAESPDIDFPEVERAKLRNGIEVVLARRAAVPAVSVVVQFDAGYAADQGGPAGLSGFTLDMMDEGTTTRDALALAAELERLGANLVAGATLDTTRLGVSTIATTLTPAVELLADVLQNPAFDPEQLERIRKQRLDTIAKELVQPVGLALRFLPPLIYGDGHPYGIPFTGTGSVEAVRAATRDDLISFRDRWLRPDNATIFVAGATTLQEVLPILEEALGAWSAPSVARGSKAAASRPEVKGRVVIIDRPGSPQTMLLAGHLAPPTGADNNLAIEAMNDAIGGKFTARVNMNLREDKGWAYGAYTFMPDARGPRPFMVYAPVQTDKTAPSMTELLKELNAYVGKKPITDAEFERIVKNLVRSLPGQFETRGAVLGAMLDNARFGRADDYVAKLSAAYRKLSRADAQAAAEQVIQPSTLIWLVVGDREKVQPELEKLGLGSVEVLDVK